MTKLPANDWTPRWYQLPFWQYMESNQQRKRAVLVWPRRHGKDLTAINWAAFASQMRVGLYWLVYPYLNQGRRIAWQGIDGGGTPFMDAFPHEIRKNQSNAEMRLDLKNGSVVQIMGADEPDRFVGANPVGVVFSEYSLMDPKVWKLTAPILAENGGWAVFIYTPRGSNHGLSLLNHAKATKGWFCSHLTAADCGVLSVDSLEEARAELKDEALFKQEFFTSFESPIQGAYYDKQLAGLYKNKQISPSAPIYDPMLPVHTAWDLGFNDCTAIWFWQEYGDQKRFIDYYESSGEPLRHYVSVLNDKDYTYGDHFGPWDLEVSDISTGKTRRQTLSELGLKIKPVKKLSILDGIEATRNLLPMCWINSAACERGLDALKSYTKEWDDQRQVFKDKPRHDWASHAADAMRVAAVARRRPPKHLKKPQRTAVTTYDMFA